AAPNNGTLFMVLQGAFSLLLSRHSSSNDIVLGVPVANRMQKELEDVIGFFVNTLVLRTDCSGNPTFGEYLNQVKTANLDAQANQDVPFEHLVERLQPTRSTAHSALFQIMFSMDTNESPTFELPGLVLSPQESDDTYVVAKYELTLNASETASGLSFSFDYNCDLFDAGTIATLAEHFTRLLGGIVADVNSPIAELPMLSDDELHYLQHTLQHTLNPAIAKQSYPTIHQTFETQAALTPDNIAVVCEGEQLSYQALNEQANQVAHYLIEQGVKPDSIVGLSFNRSPQMIVALLAILKAGGAYLPLDPTYPQERLDYMVKDSGLTLLLTQDLLDEVDSNGQPTTNPQITGLTSEHLAYVIYTSGSTGQPKGVMVTHQNLQAYYQGAKACYEVDETDNILQFSAMSLDIFV
ncbi:MAG: AMP-binding protein, partial [Psychrosphaera sp.]|nr:AMP-binding protein [Psychrosphaera sp.]